MYAMRVIRSAIADPTAAGVAFALAGTVALLAASCL